MSIQLQYTIWISSTPAPVISSHTTPYICHFEPGDLLSLTLNECRARKLHREDLTDKC